MKVSARGTKVGQFTLTKYDELKEFNCGHCQEKGKPAGKKSKNVGEWKKLDGTKVVLCNGCYGLLLSQNT